MQLFLALFRVDGGKQHAAGLETHHLSGRQVHNRNERLADELLGLIELVDAGENLAVGAGAVVEREPEKLVTLFDRLAGFDLHGAKIRFAERVKIDLLGCIRLDFQRGKQALELLLMELFQLRERLLGVYAREDRLALVDRDGCREPAPNCGGVPGFDIRICADLRENLFAGVRHERQQQRRADADRLQQVIHHAGKSRFVRFVFCKTPRHRLVDIFVGALDALEDLVERVLELEFFHLRLIPVAKTGNLRNQAFVELACRAGFRKGAAKVLFDHRRRAGDKVAEIVCQVNVDRVDKQLIGEVAVGAERERAQQEEAQRVHAEHLSKHIGVDDVAFGFRHLAAVHDEPAVPVDLFGKRQIQAHEHCRPDDRVEPDDFLADEVNVCRPVFFQIVILIVFKAERCHIVKERVNPYIDHMTRVKVDGNAPCEARSRNAKVLETGVNKVVDHFIDAGLRLEEIGLGQKLAHTVCVLGKAEEIRLFFCIVDLAAAVGALAVLELALGPE